MYVLLNLHFVSRCAICKKMQPHNVDYYSSLTFKRACSYSLLDICMDSGCTSITSKQDLNLLLTYYLEDAFIHSSGSQ